MITGFKSIMNFIDNYDYNLHKQKICESMRIKLIVEDADSSVLVQS